MEEELFMTNHHRNEYLLKPRDPQWKLYIHELDHSKRWTTNPWCSVDNEIEFLKNSPLKMCDCENLFYHCSMFSKRYYPNWDSKNLNSGCRWILRSKINPNFNEMLHVERKIMLPLKRYWKVTGKWLLDMNPKALKDNKICGMMYNKIKDDYKLSLWLADRNDFDTNIKVGVKWRSILEMQDSSAFVLELKLLNNPNILAIL